MIHVQRSKIHHFFVLKPKLIKGNYLSQLPFGKIYREKNLTHLFRSKYQLNYLQHISQTFLNTNPETSKNVTNQQRYFYTFFKNVLNNKEELSVIQANLYNRTNINARNFSTNEFKRIFKKVQENAFNLLMMKKHNSTFQKITQVVKDVFEKKMHTSNDDKNHLEEKASLKDILQLLKNERKFLALAMICLLVSSLGQLFLPVCISRIINLYGGKENAMQHVMDEVYKAVFLIFCVSTFSFFRIYFIEMSIEKITRRLRKEMFDKILNQKLSFFDKQKPGELINRLSIDIEKSSKILIHLSFAIKNCIAAVVGGICALQISPSKLVTSFLFPVFACILIGTSYGRLVKRISMHKQEQLSKCIDFASEKLFNIANVRLLNGEAYEKKQFSKYLNELYIIGKKYSLVKAGNHFLFFSIFSLFLLHLIYYGNYLIVNHFINPGDLFSLIMYSLFAGSGIQGVIHSIGDIQKCIGSCAKVLQLMKLPNEESEQQNFYQSLPFLKSSNFSVRFDNVSFAYSGMEAKQELDNTADSKENSKYEIRVQGSRSKERSIERKEKLYALKNVSFFLPHKKSVAIIGESGSGKSTLLNLITKKNVVKEGNIYIGDFHIEEINSAALRSVLGIVTQNPFLFNSTVKHNLMYPLKSQLEMLKHQKEIYENKEGKKQEETNQETGIIENDENGKEQPFTSMEINWTNLEAQTDYVHYNEYELLQDEIENTKKHISNTDNEYLKNVYKDFHIHKFLQKHSKYDQVNVGIDGSFLSGGERQRVYIAQNLLKNNKILILDEPTSSLDKLSEHIINETLQKYMRDKTTIVFTHRLALLKFVDYIGVLKEGSMIQFGLKKDVFKNPCNVLKQILTQKEY